LNCSGQSQISSTFRSRYGWLEPRSPQDFAKPGAPDRPQ
jgi:hypothetical protein